MDTFNFKKIYSRTLLIFLNPVSKRYFFTFCCSTLVINDHFVFSSIALLVLFFGARHLLFTNLVEANSFSTLPCPDGGPLAADDLLAVVVLTGQL